MHSLNLLGTLIGLQQNVLVAPSNSATGRDVKRYRITEKVPAGKCRRPELRFHFQRQSDGQKLILPGSFVPRDEVGAGRQGPVATGCRDAFSQEEAL